jgi:hypothetical protein
MTASKRHRPADKRYLPIVSTMLTMQKHWENRVRTSKALGFL